tara:strand:+ start:61 stop:393 length:333 start_codon:yes stop_codon:yes gene_type:complete
MWAFFVACDLLLPAASQGCLLFTMPAMLRHKAFSNPGGDMSTQQVVIEDWNGDGGIRIPDAALQELGVDVGDSLYLIEEFVGTTRCLVLSKTPRIPDRMDELVEAWDKGQ